MLTLGAAGALLLLGLAVYASLVFTVSALNTGTLVLLALTCIVEQWPSNSRDSCDLNIYLCPPLPCFLFCHEQKTYTGPAEPRRSTRQICSLRGRLSLSRAEGLATLACETPRTKGE